MVTIPYKKISVGYLFSIEHPVHLQVKSCTGLAPTMAQMRRRVRFFMCSQMFRLKQVSQLPCGM